MADDSSRSSSGMSRRKALKIGASAGATVAGAAVFGAAAATQASAAAGEGFIKVSADGRGFVFDNGVPFVPWGLNHDRSYYQGVDVLLEELVELSPAKLSQDFEVAASMGANTIRLHPQLPRYIPDLNSGVNTAALELLDVAVDTACQWGLKVNITGLTMIDSRAIPDWLHTATDKMISQAQAAFWGAVAARYANEPAVFCYDLQNEPFLRWDDGSLKPVGCFYHERIDANFCYLHPLLKYVRPRWWTWVHHNYPTDAALRQAWPDYPQPGETYDKPFHPNPEGLRNRRLLDYHRFRNGQARTWVSQMRNAIRAHDQRHLITVGLTPENIVSVIDDVFQPTFSAFSPQFALSGLVDFISVHLYPSLGTRAGLDPETTNLRWHELILSLARQELNKPVVIEEFHAAFGQITDWARWMDVFMGMSEPLAAGWMTFNHNLIDDLDPPEEIPEPAKSALEAWYNRFQTTAARVTAPGYSLPPAPAGPILQLDRDAVLTSGAARTQVFLDYHQLRSQSAVAPRVRWSST